MQESHCSLQNVYRSVLTEISTSLQDEIDTFLCGKTTSFYMPCEGQRCFFTTVWLIGVYCTQRALCIAHSKGHGLSGS